MMDVRSRIHSLTRKTGVITAPVMQLCLGILPLTQRPSLMPLGSMNTSRLPPHTAKTGAIGAPVMQLCLGILPLTQHPSLMPLGSMNTCRLPPHTAKTGAIGAGFCVCLHFLRFVRISFALYLH